MKLKNIYIALATLALAACQKTVMQEQGYGCLNIGIRDEVVVLPQSKVCEPQDIPNYTVKVEGQASGLPYTSAYKNFQPLTLPFGTYTVSAENATTTEAETGLGCKRLFASQQVILSSTQRNANVNLDCTVTNTLVSVQFDPSVTRHCTELNVAITGGSTSRTVNIKNTDTVQEAWFNPSAVNWTITGKVTATGKVINMTGTKTLVAKDHLTIKVSLDESNGMAGEPTLVVGTKLTEITTNVNEFNPYI